MKPLIVLSALALVVVATLVVGEQISSDTQHEQFIPHPEGPLLAVYFAHADHTEQNCVACHHNFTDDTGVGMCFDCHKTDPDVAPLIEEQFHDLCRGCHLQKQLEQQLAGSSHGPTRACISCHVKDDLP